MSMGTPIDGVVGRGFRITGGGGARGNLATDNGEGWAETVLSKVEGVEHDTDWKTSFARHAWSIFLTVLYHVSGSVSAGRLYGMVAI